MAFDKALFDPAAGAEALAQLMGLNQRCAEAAEIAVSIEFRRLEQ